MIIINKISIEEVARSKMGHEYFICYNVRGILSILKRANNLRLASEIMFSEEINYSLCYSQGRYKYVFRKFKRMPKFNQKHNYIRKFE